ncbi:MAG: 30S ribosomal protein S6 [Pirellulales bacterium]|nr:30S ribosomal protein S6 [Pirellulales bacterium]
MAENVYEGMFILDANRYTRDASGVPKQIEKLIQSAGGELIVSRLWEERRLAYPIKGQRKGVYWLTYFRIEGANLQSLNRQSEISDLILRHLFLLIDPKLVDAMIAHASGAESESKSSRAVPALDAGLEDDLDDDDLDDDVETDPDEPVPASGRLY